MRFSGKARLGMIIAPAVTVIAVTAGCASGTPVSSQASARPAAAARTATATAATAKAPAAVRQGAGAAGTIPAVFAASFALTPAKTGGSTGERIALLSSRTGERLRWLTARQEGVNDTVLSVRDGWVYFLRTAANGPAATWRVRVSGGPAQLVKAGATGYAISRDGRAVAYVTSSDHGNVLEVVARNLVTGRRNTIIMATKPDPDANNWPPDVSGLTWAPDDVHLAVQFQLTAAISSVLAFDAFTTASVRDGRSALAPCPAAGRSQCEALDPAYLASGALTYLIQRLAGSGAASTHLVTWQAGRLGTLVWFPAGAPQSYDMTAQEQAIWADGPAAPKQSWTIWRWAGGAPVKVTALPPLGASPYYGVLAIAW
jgi:hypothetical protein